MSMRFGSGVRPPWRDLFKKASRPLADYSVSPVHEIADDIDPDPGGGGDPPPPAVDIVVTGITAEFSSSELVFTETGDSTVVEAS